MRIATIALHHPKGLAQVIAIALCFVDADAEILSHPLHGKAEVEFVAHHRGPSVVELPRTRRALADDGDDGVHVEAGALTEIEGFGETLQHTGDGDLVDHLGELAAAARPEQGAGAAVRGHQRGGTREDGGVADTIDPLGGAYLIEGLTADIEARVFAELARIDELGGALAGIERGYQQQAIEESAYRYQREVETGVRIVVGVNAFQTQGDEVKIPTQRADESVGARQRERLAELRGRRDAASCERLREAVRGAAEGSLNLMPSIIAAVEGDVTLGEICADLRASFGDYIPGDRG